MYQIYFLIQYAKLQKTVDSYTVTTIAGGCFTFPSGIVMDKNGNILIADFDNQVIRKLTPDGDVTVLAGTVKKRGCVDGKFSEALFSNPRFMTVDSRGHIYLTDQENHCVRKLSTDGIVTTVAGSSLGCADGTRESARFLAPFGITIDADDNLYVSDKGNSRISKITPGGKVITIAGISSGHNDGTTKVAMFNGPSGIIFDDEGNLIISDAGNYRVRKIAKVVEIKKRKIVMDFTLAALRQDKFNHIEIRICGTSFKLNPTILSTRTKGTFLT